MRNVNILEVLYEISQNRNEKFKTFRGKFIKYCKKNEDEVFDLLRLLKGFEIELSECLNNQSQIKVERLIVIKVLKTIRTEIEIVRCRMKHLEFFIKKTAKPPPVVKWTNPKIDLIVLIYAIRNSIENGKITYKALQECIEYFFQIKLGNISNRIDEPSFRKRLSKTRYFESLIEEFNKVLDE